jgi:hypothetical protein
MLRNLTSEISVSLIINNLADSMFDSLGVVLGKDGKLFSAIEVKNPFFGDVGMKEENLDFTPAWKQKNLKLSINIVKGFLSADVTKLDMRWRSRPTSLDRERPSKEAVEHFVTRLWRRRARALEREYNSIPSRRTKPLRKLAIDES